VTDATREERTGGQRIETVVIPAAGFGTRMLPATKAVPKELLPLIDVPVIQLAVEEAVHSGMNDVLVILSRGKTLVADHFDRHPELELSLARRNKTAELLAVESAGAGASIHYTRQPEPRGLGHAVGLAREHVGRAPFAVVLPDDVMLGSKPALAQLQSHWRPGHSVVAVMPVPNREARRYGILTPRGDVADGAFEVAAMVEKPDPATVGNPAWAAMGRYILDPDVFDILGGLKPGAGGEIQLTDALAVLAGEGRLTAVVYEGQRFDVGDKLGYIKATIAYALARPEFEPAVRRYLADILAGDHA
jgi:UTP--glucose-1-phosphate uridylyltransferase